jgi:hypothetical protein
MIKKTLALVGLTLSLTANASIVGSWYTNEAADPSLPNAGGPVVLTFLASGEYLFGQDGDSIADTNGVDGMEYGTYSYSGDQLSWSTQLDTNLEWGLSDSTSVSAIESGNTLSWTVVEPNAPGGTRDIVLSRVGGSGLGGSWLVDGPTADESVLLTFLTGNQFMLVHGNNPSDDCGCGQAGIEFGSYSWNELTGEIDFSIITDTTGEFGVSHSGINSATVTGNTLTFDGSDGSFTASRVSAVPVPAAAWLFGSALIGLAGIKRKGTAKLKR